MGVFTTWLQSVRDGGFDELSPADLDALVSEICPEVVRALEGRLPRTPVFGGGRSDDLCQEVLLWFRQAIQDPQNIPTKIEDRRSLIWFLTDKACKRDYDRGRAQRVRGVSALGGTGDPAKEVTAATFGAIPDAARRGATTADPPTAQIDARGIIDAAMGDLAVLARPTGRAVETFRIRMASDEPLRQIAEQLGVAIPTVHGDLARAEFCVKRRLDYDPRALEMTYGDDAERWERQLRNAGRSLNADVRGSDV